MVPAARTVQCMSCEVVSQGSCFTSVLGALKVQVDSKPVVTEPDKCHEWKWVPFSDIPQPWFSPLRSLLESGFEPSADKSAMNVRLSEVVVSDSARSGHKTGFEVHGANENHGWDTPALEIAAAVQPSGHSTASYVGHTVQPGPESPATSAGVGGGGSEGGIVLMGATVVPPVRTSAPGAHQQR